MKILLMIAMIASLGTPALLEAAKHESQFACDRAIDGGQLVGRDVEGEPIAWFSCQVVALLDRCVVDT